MIRRIVKSAALATLLVLCTNASPARASVNEKTPPEALLPEESVLYLRFDGLGGDHRDGYNRTILANLLRDEFGPLINEVTDTILNALGPQLLSERLLEGVEPDQLLKVQSANKQIPHLLDYLWQHGFVMGVEVIAPLGPRFQVTLVFPNGGTKQNRAAVFGAFRLIGLVSQSNVEEATVGDRPLLRLQLQEPVQAACWQEGQHMVVTIGTEDVEHTRKLAQGKRPNLTTNAVYKKLAAFKRYETFERGFFDLERVGAIADKTFPPAKVVIDQLGLRGLHSVSFQVGFQGQHLRTTFELEMPGKREGLLRLLAPAEKVDMKDLPGFAPDAISVAVSRFDLAIIYDTILDTIRFGLGTFNPRDLPEFERELKSLEKVLGIDLRTDLFAHLGSQIFVYNSPSEGPLGLGLAAGIQVKNPEKLAASLETLIASLTATTGVDIHLNTKEYRGVPVNMVQVSERGFPFVPSYTIHDGWLVVGLFPQTVQGYIYRSSGKTDVWKPPAIAERVLDEIGRDFPEAKITGISVSDPRPTMRSLLSISPILVKTITGFSGAGANFDVSLIPNAQTVTDPLTHNVSVVVDDGKSVRFEGYSSLPLPFQVTGLESYVFIGAFSVLGLAF